MKDNALVLLRILMDLTDRDNKLSKNELLDMLQEDTRGESPIEEKQFYRLIEKMIDSGFPVEKTMGKYSKYYYDGDKLRDSDVYYLMNLISGATDISSLDKERLINAVNTNLFSKDPLYIRITDELSRKTIDSNLDIYYSVLDDFNIIYKSYTDMKEFKFKLYRNETISEYKKGVVDEIILKRGRTIVVINNEEYYLNEIINAKF